MWHPRTFHELLKLLRLHDRFLLLCVQDTPTGMSAGTFEIQDLRVVRESTTCVRIICCSRFVVPRGWVHVPQILRPPSAFWLGPAALMSSLAFWRELCVTCKERGMHLSCDVRFRRTNTVRGKDDVAAVVCTVSVAPLLQHGLIEVPGQRVPSQNIIMDLLQNDFWASHPVVITDQPSSIKIESARHVETVVDQFGDRPHVVARH
mmetsp:Transcript_12731/g.35183  ORF Transcript_12731/g.35183 Transcript_12731/m.35183 type:complete len:205 (+) Transcript_12731:165-779(+)